MYHKIQDITGFLRNKTAILRVDLNVPMQNGIITDKKRLVETLPTIKLILESGIKKLILLSHFGRPKADEKEFSLQQIIPDYEAELGSSIFFGETFDIAKSRDEKIVLCENLRFFKEEELGGEDFAKNLAELGDFYISDAFSCTHRAHASISVVGKFKTVYAGLLMQKEILSIESIMSDSESVFGIVGGAKVSTKIGLLKTLVTKMKTIAITGGMANTFLFAKGFEVGKSLCEKDFSADCLDILCDAQKYGCNILLPRQVVVAREFKKNSQNHQVDVSKVLEDDIILDAGTDFVLEMISELKSHTVLAWNGPLGAFETSPFNIATQFFARAVSSSAIKSIVGGGDTASAIYDCGLHGYMTYISTGGGAFLELLEGRGLPGINILYK